MRNETMTLGATPCDEPCAQAGVDPDYEYKARRECKVYKAQLERILAAANKTLPDGVRLRIKANHHDGPTYHEVEIVFPDDQCAIAYWLENNLPAKWDVPAKLELDHA